MSKFLGHRWIFPRRAHSGELELGNGCFVTLDLLDAQAGCLLLLLFSVVKDLGDLAMSGASHQWLLTLE